MAQIAKLVGLISPTGQATGFKIPIFQALESNSLLVQETTDHDIIVAFSPFFSEVALEATNINVVRKVGQKAFWFFGGIAENDLYGTKKEVAYKFRKSDLAHASPYMALQVILACDLRKQYDFVIQRIYLSLVQDSGLDTAQSFAEAFLTEIARRSVTTLLKKIARLGRFTRHIKGVEVICLEVAHVCMPGAIHDILRPRQLLRHVIDDVQALADEFGLYVTNDVIAIPNNTRQNSRKAERMDVTRIKQMIVNVFSEKNSVVLARITKSYFETDDGRFKAVCTLSSRYEGKGKRKYWYGFHEIWSAWLSDAPQAFVLLGCPDINIYYAIPLHFLKERLRYFRSTGEGKNKFWHIDLVQISGQELFIDLPGEKRAEQIEKYKSRF